MSPSGVANQFMGCILTSPGMGAELWSSGSIFNAIINWGKKCGNICTITRRSKMKHLGFREGLFAVAEADDSLSVYIHNQVA